MAAKLRNHQAQVCTPGDLFLLSDREGFFQSFYAELQGGQTLTKIIV